MRNFTLKVFLCLLTYALDLGWIKLAPKFRDFQGACGACYFRFVKC